MNLEEAMKIIESTISEKNKKGDNWYSLSLDSQPCEQDDGTFKEMYRADCLYMVTGKFSDTISGALIELAKEIQR